MGRNMKIRIKRVYDPVEKDDGVRVLVDRLWPRGLSKSSAKVDLWPKELAPSTALRRWFHGDQGEWVEFKKRYRKELALRRAEARELSEQLEGKRATFVYATKVEKHNHAQLLAAFLEKL